MYEKIKLIENGLIVSEFITVFKMMASDEQTAKRFNLNKKFDARKLTQSDFESFMTKLKDDLQDHLKVQNRQNTYYVLCQKTFDEKN